MSGATRLTTHEVPTCAQRVDDLVEELIDVAWLDDAWDDPELAGLQRRTTIARLVALRDAARQLLTLVDRACKAETELLLNRQTEKD